MFEMDQNMYAIAQIVRRIVFLLSVFSGGILSSCQSQEVSLRYDLLGGIDWEYSGEIIFTEKPDGLIVNVNLAGPKGDVMHPIHLHYGAISEDGEIAQVLGYLEGSSGEGVFDLDTLADGRKASLELIKSQNLNVRVHFDNGRYSKEIIAYTNIGQSFLKFGPGTAADVAVCTSF